MAKAKLPFKKQYLADPAICPACGRRSDPVFESIEIEGNNAIQAASCYDCGAEWHDVYHHCDIVVTMRLSKKQLAETVKQDKEKSNG